METNLGNEFTADIEVEKDKMISVSIHSNFRDSDQILYELCYSLFRHGIRAEVKQEHGNLHLNFQVEQFKVE